MTLEFKSTYIQAIRKRYFNATKKEKSAILDELCKITGFHRKYAIEILAKGDKTGSMSSGRKKAYSNEAITHLKKLWHIIGRICSKKMVAGLPIWIEHYHRNGFNEEVKAEILSMSHSSIDRYLSKYRNQFTRSKRTGTVRAKKRFMQSIPIKKFDQKNEPPGHLHADTVAHCGNSLSGQFIWTLTITDEYSGWTENRATFGKSATTILTGINQILWDYPFDIKTFNTDSGTEFINDKLQEYLDTRKIEFPRSRLYRKK
jgi:hypothetical protein